MSAGTVNSPHILLNSGIGDKDTLASLNIPVLHDLPSVGKNMSDTLVTYISWEVNSNTTLDVLLNNLTAREEAFAEWNATRTGRMSNGVVNLVGFLNMNESNPEVQQIREKYGFPGPGPTSGDFLYDFIVSSFIFSFYLSDVVSYSITAGRSWPRKSIERKLLQHARRRHLAIVT